MLCWLLTSSCKRRGGSPKHVCRPGRYRYVGTRELESDMWTGDTASTLSGVIVVLFTVYGTREGRLGLHVLPRQAAIGGAHAVPTLVTQYSVLMHGLVWPAACSVRHCVRKTASDLADNILVLWQKIHRLEYGGIDDLDLSLCLAMMETEEKSAATSKLVGWSWCYSGHGNDNSPVERYLNVLVECLRTTSTKVTCQCGRSDKVFVLVRSWADNSIARSRWSTVVI